MADLSDDIKGIIESIEEIQTDTTMPKNVKERLGEISSLLKSGEECSIKISKALDKIEEISDDSNLHSYTRTQILNIASMLESI